MEVHLKPDVQAKLEQMARESGRPSHELVEDAVVGYLDDLAYTREMLDRRFDDLESGKVKPIDGEEAYRRLMEKTEAQRQRHRPA
jgi:predicted transcriptional regulator